MEWRTRKYGHASPDRSRVRAEPPTHHHHHHPHQPPRQQQQHQGRSVPVVYYLCRNRHAEHPHFIELPTSSPEGLYLRDVINRLKVLRGKGVATMYSWSCKRSYKNGFVWRDLSEDDLILPANGGEYVLKGSELLDTSPSDRSHQTSINTRSQASKHAQRETPSPSSSRSQEEAAPFSSGVVVQEVKTAPPQLPQMPPSPPTSPPPALAPDDELSPGLQRQSPSPQNVSPQSNLSPPPGRGPSSPCPVEYQVRRANGTADASTQTEETEGSSRRARPARDARTSKGSSKICEEEVSPPTTTPPSASSSGGKLETLASLIRADARRMKNFRILEEEEVLANTGHPKLKATKVLMQLITCGSISVKGHHSFGLVPTDKPRFSHVNFPPPIYSSAVVLGELDCPAKDSRMMGLRLEGKG